MKLNALSTAFALSVALATAAQAGTIQVFGPGIATASLTATSANGASTSPFPLADFGNAGINGLVSSATPLAFQGGTINFSPNNSSPKAGVYDGSVSGVTTSAFSGTALGSRNYLVAEPNDPVDIRYTAGQTSFSLLWGTVDTYNGLSLDFLSDNSQILRLTIGGSDVATAIGGGFQANGANAAFVTLSNFDLINLPFNEVIITSTASAFEFDPSLRVPEPASLALLGGALAGLGLLRGRKNQRTA